LIVCPIIPRNERHPIDMSTNAPAPTDDASQARELFDADDAVELFRDMDRAIRERRFQAAVKPRRELHRRFGYSIPWNGSKARRIGAPQVAGSVAG
jgi:hypothetical protein